MKARRKVDQMDSDGVVHHRGGTDGLGFRLSHLVANGSSFNSWLRWVPMALNRWAYI